MEAAEEAALRLSGDERHRLIETLWDSLVEERGDQLEVSPEVRAELDRRLAARVLSADARVRIEAVDVDVYPDLSVVVEVDGGLRSGLEGRLLLAERHRAGVVWIGAGRRKSG